ncbi:related to calpain-like protease palBory [Phialocephala subalpina]|uniref:Related to calpain-like protease palBory n=1 Tax=Phialocephala subalpina TaxID=576137 RepID=A0A1L7WNX3_9HELO|nr:related to calpain-like protease palBory [Phialocephala subalpina]
MEAKALAAASGVEISLTKDEALKNAIRAVELYMQAAKVARNDDEKSRLRGKCKLLLSRAEEIKKSPQWTPKKSKTVLESKRAISKREEIILLESSKLHGFIFPQWKSDPDDSAFIEKSSTAKYTEPANLILSDAQKEIFDDWRRPYESTRDQDESLMNPVKDIDLVQDITTDCSVVASLCAGTAREIKGHDTLFASVIHPFDSSTLRPRVSKSGKYIFRLHFNGCFRQVTIDDRLPASKTTRSLHVIDRNNTQLLWPALVEKAYLKVRGGYDFPGSNSGTDLWVITGWIPEQVFLQSDDVQPEYLWNRVNKSFGYGDVMLTLGTGRLSHKEEKELGLAGEHDYAILDMKEVGSQRLLLVKNPWCDGMSWKGSQPTLSDLAETWTSDLRSALPTKSPTSPGTFWMSFEDVVQHFESLYLNWNPGLFLHRQDHHFTWTIPSIKSPGSFTHNPQYALRSAKQGIVWVLLSRHFATQEHDIVKYKPNTASSASSALGFISLYIFSSTSGPARRVYLSDNALYRGAFVDSPQTLARLDLSPSESYTIVVAQQGLPLPKYSFTLSFFSRTQIEVENAEDRLPYCITHEGAWTVRTAGGNASSPTYPTNPQFSINVPSLTDITLILETDQPELAVHVKMVWADGERVTAVTSKDIVGGSGDYRRGCAMAEIRNVAAGSYTIVCSTFEAGQAGNFTLRVGSMVPCIVKPVLSETAGRLNLQLPPLRFQDGINRMLAPLTTPRLTRLRIVARAGNAGRFVQSSKSRPSLRLAMEKGQGPNKTTMNVSNDGEFSDSPMGIRTKDLDLSPETSQPGGLWIVVERLGGSSGGDEVVVEVLSDSPVQVGLWGVGDG